MHYDSALPFPFSGYRGANMLPLGVVALATGAEMIEKDVSQDLASTEDPILPQRLYETNNRPIVSKPTCDDPSCQGIFDMVTGGAFAKYTCSNQSPVHLSESARPVILAHCRCCPRRLDVSCTHSNCATAVNTYICQAYPLRGCAARHTRPSRVKKKRLQMTIR